MLHQCVQRLIRIVTNSLYLGVNMLVVYCMYCRVQVLDLQQRLRPMREFWVMLPHSLCNEDKMAADVTNEERCWNGYTRGRCAYVCLCVCIPSNRVHYYREHVGL